MKDATSSLTMWFEVCDTHIHVGELHQLAALLDRTTDPPPAPMKTFCHARLALARAEYEHASQRFQEIVSQTHHDLRDPLSQQSIVWLAYSHCMLGNYPLAHTLIAPLLPIAPCDDAVRANLLFVRGLIAANVNTMTEACTLFEQTRILALQLRNEWLEARCCANLAAVYVSCGHMERAGRMIHRVEHLNSAARRYPQQCIQVRNIQVYRLRLLGQLQQALQHALPLPEARDDGSIHHSGWLALTTATVATDAGDFILAEQAWQRAALLLGQVQDGALLDAELLWERAWLRLRQGRIAEAHNDITQALSLSETQVDIEHLHALVIAAVIAMERDDLACVGRNLIAVCNRFRAIGHNVGLASTLLHIAGYHLREQRLDAARAASAEALLLLHEHGLHGAFYWYPPTIVSVCKLAISEDWGDPQHDLFGTMRTAPPSTAPERPSFAPHPHDLVGDFATSLAAHRLASAHWEAFAPLLRDTRPHVRRRAARVLRAANTPAALAQLALLRNDPEPLLRQWFARHVAQHPNEAIVISSFGRFDILVGGQPLKLHNAGTRKARALFGVLLLVGHQGIISSDLALLLWPEQPEQRQHAALQTTVSALRRFLKETTGNEHIIIFDTASRRYRLITPSSKIWWDWEHLRQIATTTNHHIALPIECQQAIDRSPEPFMQAFLDLLPQPTQLDPQTALRWNSIHDMIIELVEEHEALADGWIAQWKATHAGTQEAVLGGSPQT